MSKYQVGDVVRIRQWDDMVAEFGVTASNSIKCRGDFVDEMRYLCGKIFTISDIDNSVPSYDMYSSQENVEDGWTITEDMLELYYQDAELYVDPLDTKKIEEFLSKFQTDI